ncbi:MAG TPA: response regulator [Acidimicrobiia bacterium]|nr:response regulator [Acidimicrobiia bacterium]
MTTSVSSPGRRGSDRHGAARPGGRRQRRDPGRLCRRIGAVDGFDVAAETSTGQEAVAVVEGRYDLDVVVVAYQMPGMTVVAAAAALLLRRPGLPIVLCTATPTNDIVAAAEAVGIAACVDKTDIRQLPDILRRLAAAHLPSAAAEDRRAADD